LVTGIIHLGDWHQSPWWLAAVTKVTGSKIA